MQRPGIIEIECFDFQLRLVSLSQHEDVGLDLVQLSARRLPEICRYILRHVAAKPIEIELANPILEHLRHVLA